MSDDLSREMRQLAEFAEAFDCPRRFEPGLPELSRADAQSLAWWAFNIASLGRRLKLEAAMASGQGREAKGLLLLRLQLAVEEVGELAEAYAAQDLAKVLDALTDIGYVNDGTYLTHGLQRLRDPARARVHASNMSKLGADGRPLIADSGRVMKGPAYEPPRLEELFSGGAKDTA